MQGHGAVEVGLGGSHANGDRCHLDDFSGVFAHHVAAKHLVAGDLHDQLEQHLGTSGRQGLTHRAEAGPVQLDSIDAAALDCLFFGKPHAGQLRLGKYCAGHQAVVYLAWPVAVYRVGKGAALIHRNWGQVDAVCYISHRIDAGHVGALVAIYRNAVALHGHAGSLQVEPMQKRPAAGGQQHATAGDRLAALGGDAEFAGGALAGDRRWGVGEADLDALCLHTGAHRFAGFAVEAAQQVIAAHQLGHLHA